MSIETQAPATQTRGRNQTGENQKDAEAWLNLAVTDAAGNPHNIRCFIPLTSDNAVHKALMVKAQAMVDAGEAVAIPLVGSVNFVNNEEIVL